MTSAATPVTLDDIGCDAHVIVFEELPLDDVISARAVCRRWRDAFARDSLWDKRVGLLAVARCAVLAERWHDFQSFMRDGAVIANILHSDLSDSEVELFRNASESSARRLSATHQSIVARMVRPGMTEHEVSLMRRYAARISESIAQHCASIMHVLGCKEHVAATDSRLGLWHLAESTRRRATYLQMHAGCLITLWRHGPQRHCPKIAKAIRWTLTERFGALTRGLSPVDPIVLCAKFSLSAFLCEDGDIKGSVRLAKLALFAANLHIDEMSPAHEQEVLLYLTTLRDLTGASGFLSTALRQPRIDGAHDTM